MGLNIEGSIGGPSSYPGHTRKHAPSDGTWSACLEKGKGTLLLTNAPDDTTLHERMFCSPLTTRAASLCKNIDSAKGGNPGNLPETALLRPVHTRSAAGEWA
jgi:hypothetical protein